MARCMRERVGHSLRNSRSVLRPVGPPREWSGPDGDGASFGVFCGYLVLDGLIANTDRHEENWSVIRDAGGRIRLCASYDHATSLGFNLADAQRERLLDDPARFAAWLRRGTANRFEGGRRVTLVAHAVSGITLAPNWARSWWVNSLEALDLGALRTLLDTADPPSLSEPARTFAIELIEANRRRLLDEFDGP